MWGMKENTEGSGGWTGLGSWLDFFATLTVVLCHV